MATPTKKRARDEGMTPEDIARLDAEEYEEPGRELMATRPAEEASGDVDNPVAQGHSGAQGQPAEGQIGSDQRNVIARGNRYVVGSDEER